MAPNDFLELLQRRPFEPFRLHLGDGAVYDIRHPEMAALKLSVVWLYFPGKDIPIPIAESKVVVVLHQIVFIEFIQTKVGPSAN